MLATWGTDTQHVVVPTTPEVVTVAKQREAASRRDRRKSATAVVPIPTVIPQQQNPQHLTPPTVTVELASQEIDEALSDEERALSEAAISEARLRHAALEGDVDTIDLLLRGSMVGRRPRPPVSPDVASEDSWTPLMYACLHGHYHAAQLLVSRSANVHATTVLGDTPLALSAAASDGATSHEQSERAAVVALLLAAGANVDAANGMGMTALHRAALHGVKIVARVLLKAGARPELLCKRGLSAVDRAAVGSDVRDTIVKAQLKRGRRRVGGTAPADIDAVQVLQPFGSSLMTDSALGSQLVRQSSIGTSLAKLSDQVIDRHCSFSGVPSWQRVESIDSRLHDLAQVHVRNAGRGKRRTGSASMQLRKLNLPTDIKGSAGHGGENGLHVVAEGKHILSPAETRQLQSSSLVSMPAPIM